MKNGCVWDEDDEFRYFDPRRHWAEENSEFIADIIPKKELKLLEDLIVYLRVPRTYLETKKDKGISQGNMTRLLNMLRSIRGVQVERREIKMGVNSYQVIDGRRKS